MRILHISSALHFGGGERHFADLARGLGERGHVVFAALRPRNDWQARLDFLPPENILHVSIRNSFGVFSALRITDFIKENKIDIVHAHVARDYIPASLACGLARQAKFVLTRHVLFPLKPFNRFALKNLSRAVAVSPGVADALNGIFPKSKIAMIPNGIRIYDTAETDTKKLGEEFRFLHEIPFDVPLIGAIGELVVLKGQRDFVLAAQEVAKQFPDARFLIVGKDNSLDKKFRRELKRLVSVFGMEDRFLWLDWVEDLAPVFAALDVFVSPSHSESFGLAILEAMTAGKTVVATETAGATELLQNNDLLVPINEPLRLAKKICELLGDDERRLAVGAELRDRACKNFSLEKMIDLTALLYEEILEGA